MIKRYTKIYLRTLLLAAGMCISFTMAGTPKTQKVDSTYLRLSKANKKDKNFLKTSFHVTLPVVKPYIITPSKPLAVADDKLLSNVQVYPNPVTDQINVKYTISRPSNVNIKIMDVLGNEVMTLFSQRVEAGEWKATGSPGKQLQSGFYFVRIVVGTESVIKRISIL
jgi:hypothetical protein